jgi:hypothetical protein
VSDDALGRIVAAMVVVVFLVAQGIAFTNPTRPVPSELYPLTTLAVGYLLGWRLISRNGKNGR